MYKYRNRISALLITGIILTLAGCSAKKAESSPENDPQSPDAAVLIFSKTEGFRHASIPDGVKAVEELAAQHKVKTRHTENAAYFNQDTLSRYDAVLFLSTTGNILNEQQQAALEQFINQGGGFIGIHAAADTEYEWPWYGKMVGAYFESHPEIQKATITVKDKEHPATSFLPDEWTRTDEWYNYKDINSHIKVLLNLEESSYKGGKNGESHPIAWYHQYDGGRVFYTGGGHTSESYTEPQFLKHIWGGMQWVLGMPGPAQ